MEQFSTINFDKEMEYKETLKKDLEDINWEVSYLNNKIKDK